MDKNNYQQLEARVKELEAKIKELEVYVDMKKQQQISYPLDKNSKDLIIFAVNNP